MTDVGLSAFSKALERKAFRERRPVACLFEVTPVCNLRCHFCYVALDPYKGPYLSTEQIKRVFAILEEQEVLFVTLTGGEIFARRDFAEIYRDARRRGLLVTLYTNATMIRDEHVQLLREEPPLRVEVSIYGATAEQYEAVTRIPGSFEKFVGGVERLRAAGVNLTLKAPLSRFNADHVPELIAWSESRGIPFKLDPSLDLELGGGRGPELYRIEPQKVSAIKDELFERQHGRPRKGPHAECSVEPPPEIMHQLYTCGAGRVGFFIDALGRASHCVSDRDPNYPILGMPFEAIWAQMGEWVSQPLPADAPCRGCTLRAGCSNCPARSRLATGSPYLKDTYFCDITHIDNGLEPETHPNYSALARARTLAACVA